jgi:dolichol-phosphate mannosyltransferase
MNSYNLNQKYIEYLKSLEGPIMIFGAGGFIGINILKAILEFRSDVYGVSQDHHNNWRFIANQIPAKNLKTCDINQITQLNDLIKEIKPKTVFNLAAYGAYSKQKEYSKIYKTNFIASADIIESIKEYGFEAYIHAGSSSEYGLNSNAPDESSELIPNSHYSVSKAAVYQAIKYYGKIEKLPVLQLRLYSVFGPWEEPDRLIPVLISKARKKEFPNFVDGEISRDFIFISDVISAFISAAANIKTEFFGNAYNIGSGEKTTIKELAFLCKEIFEIDHNPEFANMQNRRWDLKDWYSNPKNAKLDLKWECEANLKQALKNVAEWQKNINFDNAFWNYNK